MRVFSNMKKARINERGTYLYSLTRQFLLSESVLVENPELGVTALRAA